MSLARKLIPPSLRFTLRQLQTRARVRAPLLTPWRWVARKYPLPKYDVITFAPEGDRLARELLSLEGEGLRCSLLDAARPNAALVSPMVIPNALRVPCDLHALVPLGRPLDDIVARYDRELRRTLHKHRSRYTFTQVTDAAAIERFDREMLIPYARARHRERAVIPRLDDVLTMALETGHLHLACCDGVPVACHLADVLERGGQRHFITSRFGYPAAVFEDPKQLREVKAMNTYLALEWSHANGFDFYDMGSAPARPSDGLLQWKRRRDGAVDASHTEEWLSVRPPRALPAAFFWDHPLFSAGSGGLELQLGLAAGVTDDEAITCFHELGFSGLTRVRLHAARTLAPKTVDALRTLYQGQTLRPLEIVVHAPRPLAGVVLAQPAAG
jgi:hypothetical protein